MKISPVVAAGVALALCVGAGAIAGTRAKDKNTQVPSTTGDGIVLSDSLGCRISARVDGGGGFVAGKLVPYYRDNAITKWEESHEDLHCTVSTQLDGGQRSAVVCPDIPVAGRFGLISVGQYGLIGLDGGTGAATGGTQPVLRVECWGPAIP